jgi:hypothetical protein
MCCGDKRSEKSKIIKTKLSSLKSGGNFMTNYIFSQNLEDEKVLRSKIDALFSKIYRDLSISNIANYTTLNGLHTQKQANLMKLHKELAKFIFEKHLVNGIYVRLKDILIKFHKISKASLIDYLNLLDKEQYFEYKNGKAYFLSRKYYSEVTEIKDFIKGMNDKSRDIEVKKFIDAFKDIPLPEDDDELEDFEREYYERKFGI